MRVATPVLILLAANMFVTLFLQTQPGLRLIRQTTQAVNAASVFLTGEPAIKGQAEAKASEAVLDMFQSPCPAPSEA